MTQSKRQDLNLRFHGPEPRAIPDFATPRNSTGSRTWTYNLLLVRQTFSQLNHTCISGASGIRTLDLFLAREIFSHWNNAPYKCIKWYEVLDLGFEPSSRGLQPRAFTRLACQAYKIIDFKGVRRDSNPHCSLLNPEPQSGALPCLPLTQFRRRDSNPQQTDVRSVALLFHWATPK